MPVPVVLDVDEEGVGRLDFHRRIWSPAPDAPQPSPDAQGRGLARVATTKLGSSTIEHVEVTMETGEQLRFTGPYNCVD